MNLRMLKGIKERIPIASSHAVIAPALCVWLGTHFCEQVEITGKKRKKARKKCEIK